MKFGREEGLPRTWPLTSGTWERLEGEPGFKLLTSALGHPVSDECSAADVGRIVGASTANAGRTFYPPEFRFDPQTGDRLALGCDAQPKYWVSPFGLNSAGAKSKLGPVRGLHQAALPLSLRNQRTRSAVDDPDRSLPPPPSGHFEFFSIPSAGIQPTLLALDPLKHLLYAWLSASEKWAVMADEHNGVLAHTHIHRADWRAEAVVDDKCSRIFLPTERGIACVVPDALSLTFEVSYNGASTPASSIHRDARALASPIHFADRIWAPLQDKHGVIALGGLSLDGSHLGIVELQGDVPSDLGRISAPVATSTAVIWVTPKGQLQLVKSSTGQLEGGFTPWPEGVVPQPQFGSPYLGRDGRLWMVFLDSHADEADAFMYGTLSQYALERQIAQPRLCTGKCNFRFATKQSSPPWIEPEHGDDSASDSMVIPLLESVSNDTVFGLKIRSTKGIESVLELTERTSLQLVVDDADSQVAFGTLALSQPLDSRFFVHEGHLWFYHPERNKIDGWTLELE